MAKLLGTGITADRTAHWPDNDAYVVTAAASVVMPSAFVVGDLLQASGTTTLAKLAAVATGNVLLSGGVTTASAWGKVGLTTHVSGTLPVANGGSGLATLTANALYVGNGTSAPTAVAVGATGTVLVGATGADPSFSATPTLTSWTTTAVNTNNVNGIAFTSTDGLIVQNATAATVGSQYQFSPRIRQAGRAWDTDDNVSRTVSFFTETWAQPGATVYGIWKLGYIDPVSAAENYILQLHTLLGNLTFSNGAGLAKFMIDSGNLNFVWAGNFKAGFAPSTDASSGPDTYLIRTGAGAMATNGTFSATAYLVGATAGIDASITTGALVGKTITVSKGIITGFA